jgi:transposase
MPKHLSQQEINPRMLELQNLRMLHTKARERITSLENENKQLKAEMVLLKKENTEFKTKLTDLGYQFEQMKAIVFGKKGSIRKILQDDDTDNKPSTPRSKESYTRPIPKESEVTHTIHHPAPTDISSTRTRTKTFFVEDIPLDIKKTVTKHIVDQVWNGSVWRSTCNIPTTTVTLGNNIRMLVSTLSVEQRLSYTQIQQMLELLFHIHISQGEIVAVLTKESYILQSTYDVLLNQVQGESCQHIDETSWDIKSERCFAWGITGPSGISVYTLGMSRGIGVAQRLYGSSTGVLVSDDYLVYKNLSIEHQLCFAHLIRKFRDFAQHPSFEEAIHQKLVQKYQDCKDIFKELRETTKQDNPELKQGYFNQRLTQLGEIETTDPPPVKRIKTTLQKNILKYLTCLRFPHIPLTNNTAEQSLRHLVIKRRISFGSTSHKGAHVLSVLMTVLKHLLKTHPGEYFERYAELRVVQPPEMRLSTKEF